MIKHIVSWNLNEDIKGNEREEILTSLKASFEALKDKLDYLIDIKLIINHLESSTVDLALICDFEDTKGLSKYQVSPEHLEVAAVVRRVCCNRNCIDYEY